MCCCRRRGLEWGLPRPTHTSDCARRVPSPAPLLTPSPAPSPTPSMKGRLLHAPCTCTTPHPCHTPHPALMPPPRPSPTLTPAPRAPCCPGGACPGPAGGAGAQRAARQRAARRAGGGGQGGCGHGAAGGGPRAPHVPACARMPLPDPACLCLCLCLASVPRCAPAALHAWLRASGIPAPTTTRGSGLARAMCPRPAAAALACPTCRPAAAPSCWPSGRTSRLLWQGSGARLRVRCGCGWAAAGTLHGRKGGGHPLPKCSSDRS